MAGETLRDLYKSSYGTQPHSLIVDLAKKGLGRYALELVFCGSRVLATLIAK